MPVKARTIAVASNAAQIFLGEEPAIMDALASADWRLRRVTGWQSSYVAEVIPMARTGDDRKYLVCWTK